MDIINKALIYVLVAVILLLSGVGIYQHFKLNHLAHEVKVLTDDNTNLKNEVTNCKNNINQQNSDITAAKSEADKKQQAIDDLGKELKDQQERNKKLVDSMKAVAAPKTCQEAQVYLKKNLEIFIW